MAKSKPKTKLPKRIAGVKVPKAARKGRFARLLASPKGQALLAEAAMGAGALALAAAGRTKSGKSQGLPRKLAGVKVPDKVRKGRFGAFLASPAGRALVADAMIAAGAVAAARKTKTGRAVGEMAGEAGARAAGARKVMSAEAGAAGAVIAWAAGEAARAFADALQRRREDALAQTVQAGPSADAPHFDTPEAELAETDPAPARPSRSTRPRPASPSNH